VASPTLTTTGTAGPDAIPDGISTLTGMPPATMSVTPPAQETLAGRPPISAITGRFGFGRTVPAIFHPLLLVRFILPL